MKPKIEPLSLSIQRATEIIKQLANERKIQYSLHAKDRDWERSITRKQVEGILLDGYIIENRFGATNIIIGK